MRSAECHRRLVFVPMRMVAILDVSLREIARVLKPGGRLGLLFRTEADLATVASFPHEIYRFPAFDEVTAALEQVGLVHVTSDANEPVLLLAEKRRALVATESCP